MFLKEGSQVGCQTLYSFLYVSIVDEPENAPLLQGCNNMKLNAANPSPPPLPPAPTQKNKQRIHTSFMRSFAMHIQLIKRLSAVPKPFIEDRIASAQTSTATKHEPKGHSGHSGGGGGGGHSPDEEKEERFGQLGLKGKRQGPPAFEPFAPRPATGFSQDGKKVLRQLGLKITNS